MTQTLEKLSLGQIEDIPFSHLKNLPSTLVGYGITDAYTKIESDARFVRYDGVQSLTLSQQLQARTNIGAISSAGVTSLTRSTGILFSTGSSIISTGTISFDVAWGDNRYHNRLGIISNSSTWNFLGNVEGIQVRAWTSGSSNFPSTLGSGIFIYTGSNSTASAMGRTMGLIRNYNTESYYLGSSNTAGNRNPWRLIWHSGNLNPTNFQNLLGYTPENVNNKVNNIVNPNNISYLTSQAVVDNFVTLGTSQVITGLKYLRRGSASGELLHTAFDYPDNNGDDYHLRFYNDGSNNNIKWYFRQKSILGVNNVILDLPVLGFKNGVTLIGTDNYPFTEVETYYNSQTNPAVRYPLSCYTQGDSMISGRLYVGKNNFIDTLFLTSDDKFYSEGRVYAREGIRTRHPNGTLDNTTWLLGNVNVDTVGTFNRKIRISVNNQEIDLLGIAVVV